MSSLTRDGSSMETEQYYAMSADEVIGTHLSLGIGGGGGAKSLNLAPAPPRTVQLFGEVLSVQDDDDPRCGGGVQAFHHRGRPTATAPASRKKKRDAAAATGDASAADRYQSKKAKTACRDDGDGGGGGRWKRKKLRLTADQATRLEDSFRANNILSHGEKQELARRVGLSARQVEVWFQNRRARTKLKQTEVDCDLLRRWCDRLADDNARLRRDLADLRRAAAASPTRLVCASWGGGADKQQQIAVVAGSNMLA